MVSALFEFVLAFQQFRGESCWDTTSFLYVSPAPLGSLLTVPGGYWSPAHCLLAALKGIDGEDVANGDATNGDVCCEG